jgi:hypothetical protein
MENAYKGMGMDTMPDRLEGHYQHQHQYQGVPQQLEQQSLSHPFTVDSNAGAIWSNVPTGFECVNFALFCSLILVTIFVLFYSLIGVTYLFSRSSPSAG